MKKLVGSLEKIGTSEPIQEPKGFDKPEMVVTKRPDAKSDNTVLIMVIALILVTIAIILLVRYYKKKEEVVSTEQNFIGDGK